MKPSYTKYEVDILIESKILIFSHAVNPNHIGVKHSLIVLGGGGQIEPFLSFDLLFGKKFKLYVFVMTKAIYQTRKFVLFKGTFH